MKTRKHSRETNARHHWANRETAQQHCRLGLTSSSEGSAAHSSVQFSSKSRFTKKRPALFLHKCCSSGRLSLRCFSVTAMHANSTKRQPERPQSRMGDDSKTVSPWCAILRPAVRQRPAYSLSCQPWYRCRSLLIIRAIIIVIACFSPSRGCKGGCFPKGYSHPRV